MKDYQQQFLALALKEGALGFGAFELKSGRTSPYFFNAGRFSSGAAMSVLGRCYAEALVRSGMAFDMLFGPAYKGITLAAITAVALAEHHGRDVPVVYNRKEAKQHGEGGQLVGPALQGNVVIIDDVITAGTAIRESVTLIEAAGASVGGVLIGLDRQEKGQGERSTIQEFEGDRGISVASIVKLEDILEYLAQNGVGGADMTALQAYRERWGVS